ncbi:MAG TPA: hypothetical protein VJQ26_10170, partial [Ktedonobacteraceae bacterium]|nr:hypothetical protein [Ktedonobacteraceae bacterium]
EVIKAGAIARALLVEMSRLDKGRIVFDRFLEGARMYWAVKDLQPIPEIVLSELRGPDHVILLDIDPKIAIVRRNHPSERTRDEELTYLQKCATYLRNKAVEDQWKVVDASLPLEIVESEINQLLTQLEGSRV